MAFGRDGCAEQSVISETLNACTAENVEQMEQAVKEIYQRHSAGYHHDYEHSWQLLDIDMTGQPCGKKAVFATKGYFAKQRNRRGRQLGRVLATWYEEIVVDRLYDGKTQLPKAFQELVLAAEEVLDLDEEKRERTILRMDGHGGSRDDVNWALERGYHLHTKEYSTDRARKLAETVETWHDDPKVPGRQVGWVTAEPVEYVRPVKRIAVRTRKKNGQWGVGVLISTLPAEAIGFLAHIPARKQPEPVTTLLAYVYFYDLRGGGVETEIREDKQGLGITRRNKKRFEAQQMIVQLNALAHNLIIWSRRWLARTWNKVENLGILRMVRDVFHLSGLVYLDEDRRIERIILHQGDPFALGLSTGLPPLLTPLQVAVILGEI
ncbi:transposase [Candidatus Parcubacteria bacterium]|nr:MAG: transposase [Candidatus Parcubacteria bacterium]